MVGPFRAQAAPPRTAFALGLGDRRQHDRSVTDGVPTFLLPLQPPRSIHLWKAIAPFVHLEEMLFAHDPRALRAAEEAFVATSLPEASITGRVA